MFKIFHKLCIKWIVLTSSSIYLILTGLLFKISHLNKKSNSSGISQLLCIINILMHYLWWWIIFWNEKSLKTKYYSAIFHYWKKYFQLKWWHKNWKKRKEIFILFYIQDSTFWRWMKISNVILYILWAQSSISNRIIEVKHCTEKKSLFLKKLMLFERQNYRETQKQRFSIHGFSP